MQTGNPDVWQDMKDFHDQVIGGQISDYPCYPSSKIHELRKKLVVEEYDEFMRALIREDLTGMADGAFDLIVVVLGTLLAYGIPFPAVWHEGHASNMAKKDGPMREDGKKLKPPGWKPPNFRQILLDAGMIED